MKFSKRFLASLSLILLLGAIVTIGVMFLLGPVVGNVFSSTSYCCISPDISYGLQSGGNYQPQVYPTLAPPNDASYDAVYFESAGVNPFIDTEDDPLSTFAVDVDTGSYTIMRRYLRDGNLPPKEAVRVEEYVNYFEQGYPKPAADQVFSLNLDGGPFPFAETERYRMLRVGLQGYAVPPEARPEMALTFVVDVSGSMDREDRLELVKDALEILVNELRPEDSVSIVIYGDQAWTVLEPTSGTDKETILAALAQLYPQGVTNAEAGLRLGYEQALRAFKPGGINRVILCSDGVANAGQTGADSIWDEIETYASEGITLTSLGFGMGNYNDVLLEGLADQGDGFYAYIDTLPEARRLFVDNLGSTLQVIAMDAKIQVVFNPEVVSRYRLVGFENRAVADEDFRNDQVDGGEIGAGHQVTALYEIKLQPEVAGQIAEVYLRWQDPQTRTARELSAVFETSDLADSFEATDPYFQRAVVVAEYAEILRQSIWAEDSDLETVLAETRRVNALVERDRAGDEFSALVGMAAGLADE